MGITKDLHLIFQRFPPESPRAQLAAHHPWLCVESSVQFAGYLFLNQAAPFCWWLPIHGPYVFFHMIGLGGHNFFLCFLDLRELDAWKTKAKKNTLPTGDGKTVIYHCSTISVQKNSAKKIPGTQNDDPGCVLR